MFLNEYEVYALPSPTLFLKFMSLFVFITSSSDFVEYNFDFNNKRLDKMYIVFMLIGICFDNRNNYSLIKNHDI